MVCLEGEQVLRVVFLQREAAHLTPSEEHLEYKRLVVLWRAVHPLWRPVGGLDMDISSLITVLYGLLIVTVGIYIISALTLGFKSKVLSVKELAERCRNPVPPRRMLNDFGKRIHSILCISGVLATVFLLMLLVVEFMYGGTCPCSLTNCGNR